MTRIAILVFLYMSLLYATLWAKAEETLTVTAATKSARHEPPPRKIIRHVQRLILRYDTDGNETLNSAEWDSMQGQPAVIDRDQNGQITSTELVYHIVKYARTRKLGQSSLGISEASDPIPTPANGLNRLSKAADQLSETEIDSADNRFRKYPDAPFQSQFHVPAKGRLNHLPNWFSQRDQNGDGQLSLAEFSPTHSRESVKAFQKLDTNRDGLVTPQESVRPKQEPRPEKKPAGEAGL